MRKEPHAVEVLRSRVAGSFVWEDAARAGIPTTVVRAPLAEGRPDLPGLELLSGAWQTDASNGLGDWWVYTGDPRETAEAPAGRRTRTAGTVFRLRFHGGLAQSELPGPRNVWLIDRLERRFAAIAELGVDVDVLDFEASYGRTALEYYDGFVFAFSRGGQAVATGGRYDALTRRLGDGRAVPATGGPACSTTNGT